MHSAPMHAAPMRFQRGRARRPDASLAWALLLVLMGACVPGGRAGSVLAAVRSYVPPHEKSARQQDEIHEQLGQQLRCFRPGDQWWEIDTRCVGCGPHPDLTACRLRSGVPGQARGADFQDLYRAMQDRATLIVVHGYDYEPADAQLAAARIYGMSIGRSRSAPVNFVVWSWPSDRDGRLVRDAQQKGLRTNFESHLFSQLLRMHEGRHDLSVMGYSLGARIIAGGLHYWALEEPQAGAARARTQTLLVAAAVDARWFAPGGRYALATDGLGRLTNLINVQDPVLKRYHFLQNSPSATALGGTGIPHAWSTAIQWQQCDVSAQVGHHHGLVRYLESSKVLWELQQLAHSVPHETLETATVDAP